MAHGDAIERSKWDFVRRDFEASMLTDAAICRKYEITRDELWAYARTQRWTLDHRGFELDRSLLIRQMLAALDHQVARLENMKAADITEKEAAVLGKLATTLEKLIDINRQSGGDGQHETGEMRELRNKLARRIERLKRHEL